MRIIPKRPSVGLIGLEEYLNLTKNNHGGNGYDTFINMLNDKEISYSKRQIADKFHVSRNTVYTWIKLKDAQ